MCMHGATALGVAGMPTTPACGGAGVTSLQCVQSETAVHLEATHWQVTAGTTAQASAEELKCRHRIGVMQHRCL